MALVGMRLNQAKGLFFDRQKVLNSVGRAERRVLSKFGAFVRRGARSSIRKRKRSSKRGQPPSSHTGLLKRNIFFVYEPVRSSVVIGPIRLNQAIGDAPAALEHGGRTQVLVGRRRKRRKVRTVTIQPRPFMGPAFEREQPKLPQMWKDSVR
jgi:hypothetical protein